MRYLGKVKQALFVISRLVRRQKLPAKRRDFRVLGTLVGRDGEVPAMLQNISETGLCFVVEQTALPEEFMIRLHSPLERKDRNVRCRRVWCNTFESRGISYVRVGCSFKEQGYRLRWLEAYLTDEFVPVPETAEAEAA